MVLVKRHKNPKILGACIVATSFRGGFWWDKSYPLGISTSSTITNISVLPERIKVVEEEGKKKLSFSADSFWGIPPVDLGKLRSDRLDEFLYGAEA